MGRYNLKENATKHLEKRCFPLGNKESICFSAFLVFIVKVAFLQRELRFYVPYGQKTSVLSQSRIMESTELMLQILISFPVAVFSRSHISCTSTFRPNEACTTSGSLAAEGNHQCQFAWWLDNHPGSCQTYWFLLCHLFLPPSLWILPSAQTSDLSVVLVKELAQQECKPALLFHYFLTI